LIDPFAPGIPDRLKFWSADPNATYNKIEDISISTIDDNIFNAFYSNGTVIGWTWGNISLRDHLDQWDLMTGEFLGTINHTHFPGMKYPKFIIDIDGDGNDELIYIRHMYGYGDGLVNISAFDPHEGTFLWESTIRDWYDYYSDVEISIVDFGGDGEMQFLLSSRSSRKRPDIASRSFNMALISLSDGTVILNRTTRLDPHHGLDPYEEVNSFLVEEDNHFTVIDADKGELGPFEFDNFRQVVGKDLAGCHVYFMDLNGDGKKEITIFLYYPNMGRIIRLDPYDDDPKFIEEWTMGRIYIFTYIVSSQTSCILLSHKNLIYWVPGEISVDKSPADPIFMNQINVYIKSNPGSGASGLMDHVPKESRPIAATICVGGFNVILLVILGLMGRSIHRKKMASEKKMS
jgi:hypothetical protein